MNEYSNYYLRSWAVTAYDCDMSLDELERSWDNLTPTQESIMALAWLNADGALSKVERSLGR